LTPFALYGKVCEQNDRDGASIMASLSKSRWFVLSAYALIGLALGFADPCLGRVAQALGARPGVATATSVNALLPLVAAVLGYCHARIALAGVGSMVMTSGFIMGLAGSYSVVGQDWSPAGLLRSVPSVLVVAAGCYIVIGMVAARARPGLEAVSESPRDRIQLTRLAKPVQIRAKCHLPNQRHALAPVFDREVGGARLPGR
jgi:hypothetical protein